VTGRGDAAETASQARTEVHAERWGVGAFVVGGLVTVIAMGGSRLPLAGPDSVGGLAAWVAAASTGLAFAVCFALEARSERSAWRAGLPLPKRVLDLLAMSGAMAMLSYLLVLAVASVFQLGFHGLTVDPLGGGALAGAAAAALTYMAARWGAHVTADGLAALATLVLFVGTMASMLSTPDESWWQMHFSQLGNVRGDAGYRFNLALIVTGLVITVLSNYVGHSIESGLRARGVDPKRRTTVLTWLFAGIGLCLIVAGSVTDALSRPIHVGVATGMTVIYAVFAVLSVRYLPGLPREVAGLSLFVVIGILAAVALWVPIGYFNLTGVEFIVAGLLFAWLLVFSRAIDAYALGDIQTTDASAPAGSDVTVSESGRAEQAAPTSSPSP
jgi:hypothetical membrane protein